jgi:hypothetical protein
MCFLKCQVLHSEVLGRVLPHGTFPKSFCFGKILGDKSYNFLHRRIMGNTMLFVRGSASMLGSSNIALINPFKVPISHISTIYELVQTSIFINFFFKVNLGTQKKLQKRPTWASSCVHLIYN